MNNKELSANKKLLKTIRQKLKDPDLLNDLKNEMNKGKNLKITNVDTTFTDTVSAK